MTSSRTHKTQSNQLREDGGTLETDIDESLNLVRKIESRKKNFSLNLENLIDYISLSFCLILKLSYFSQFLRVQIKSSTSFIANGFKLINLYLFQRSDITFSHMIWI